MADCEDDDIVISRTAAFSDRLSQELETLCNNFTDVTLRTGDKVVKCHRLIIAANSPVLKAMLKSQMKDTTEKQIKLNNISPQAMDNIVEYMYSGKTRIAKETLMDIIEAADYLLMDDLKQVCIDQAPAVLQPSNAISWFKFSDKMNLTDLHSQCSKIMTSQLHEIKSGQEFLELKIAELYHYLHEVKQMDADPDDLLGASLDWVNACPEDRGKKLEQLVQAAPMEQCSLQCLIEELQKYRALLCTNSNAALRYLQSMKHNPGTREFRRLKKVDPMYLIVGGNRFIFKNNQCWLLDSTSSLTEFCEMPYEHLHRSSSFCPAPQGFILTGGEDSDGTVMFNMKKKTWKKLTKMLIKRYAHGSAFVKGLLFIFGGFINECYSNSVQYLDENGLWQSGPDLPMVAVYPEVLCLGDDVYVLDTWNSNALFKLNIVSKLWSRMAQFPGGRSYGARMIQVNDHLCLAGGENKILAWYSPSADTWSLTNATPHLHHSWGAVLHQHKTIMILGGVMQKKVESYDIDTGVWSVCDWEMPEELQNIHGLKLH